MRVSFERIWFYFLSCLNKKYRRSKRLSFFLIASKLSILFAAGSFSSLYADDRGEEVNMEYHHIQARIKEKEQEGSYSEALQLARGAYEELSKSDCPRETFFLSKQIKRLEEEVLTLGFSRCAFDRDGNPRPLLLQLLKLVGMGSLDKSETAIVQINRWAQDHLLRVGERWDFQTRKFERLTPQLAPLLEKLGFIKGSSPHFREYEGALLQSGRYKKVCSRLSYLAEKWEEGVRFLSLYFLTSERPLREEQEGREVVMGDPTFLSKMQKGWTSPDKWPATEGDMMKLLWEKMDIPLSMRQQIKVIFICAPMKKEKKHGRLIRPTTNDAVQHWLQTDPPYGAYLNVTNWPYGPRQDGVMRGLCPKKYQFDTIGPAATEDEETMAIYLDEVARYIFQVKKNRENSSENPYQRT